MEDQGVRPAVARVLGPTGEPAGAAFLVTPDLLLTAAHVVSLAAGNAADGTGRPDGEVRLDFAAAPGESRRAAVAHWVPPGTTPPEDIAGLRLLEPAPAGTAPASLTDVRVPLGRRVMMLGFPRYAPHGGWGIGQLADADARNLVQVDTLPDSQFTIEAGFSGTPVWDVADGAVAGLVVEGWTRGRRSGFMIPTSVLLAAWPALAAQVWPASPFRGLRSFTEQDSGVFFGRDELIERVAALSESAPALTVVGPSGIGKSSLLHAGVLPRLRQRPGLVVATMRPSDAQTPLRALAQALARAAEPSASPLTLGGRVDEFAARLERGLVTEVVGAVADSRRAERLLLVVDQFEEIFIAGDDLVAQAAPALTHCLRPQSRMDLLAGLRADFLGRVLQRRDLAELVRDVRLVTVGELSISELRAVIAEPVERTRLVRYEPGLVDRLLADVGAAPGRLPLLQFALAMLWERQESGVLEHRAYDALGGIDVALAGHAEAVWQGLGGTHRDAAGRLLVQLLYPLADGAGFVRRPAPRAQLDDRQWDAAQRLAGDRARLVVVRAQDTGQAAELAHDALVTHWRRLRGLAERDREFREWQESLRQRIARWQRGTHRADRLLAGADLRDALRWRARRAADLAPAELSYIAESQRRRGRRRRRLGLGVAAVAAVVALIITQVQSGVSGDAADNMIKGMSHTDPYDQLRTTLRAYKTSATDDSTREVEIRWAQYARIDRVLPDYTARPLPGGTGNSAVPAEDASAAAQKISADGRTMVTTDPRGDITVWRIHGGQVTGRALGQTAVRVTISRNGRYVAYLQDTIMKIGLAGGNSCTARDLGYCVVLYDTVTGHRRQLGTLQSSMAGGIPVLRFDPTGRVLAVAFMPASGSEFYRQRVITWTVPDGRPRSNTLVAGTAADDGELDAVRDMWLAPGGRRLLMEAEVPSHPQGRVLYDVLATVSLTGTKAPIVPLAGDAGSTEFGISEAGVSGDGRRVVALVQRSPITNPHPAYTLMVWDLAAGRAMASALPQTPAGTSIALDQHGNLAFLESVTGTVSVWRVGRIATQQATWHVDSLWEAVLPAGDGAGTVLALVEGDVIGLVLPAPGEAAPMRRLAGPRPYVPGESPAAQEHPRQWADTMTSMLASGVPVSGELTGLPAGAYTGRLGG